MTDERIRRRVREAVLACALGVLSLAACSVDRAGWATLPDAGTRARRSTPDGGRRDATADVFARVDAATDATPFGADAATDSADPAGGGRDGDVADTASEPDDAGGEPPDIGAGPVDAGGDPVDAGETMPMVCATDADCDDADVCTDDHCLPGGAACTHAPSTALCDDGDPCTQGDQCTSGTCAGAAVACVTPPLPCQSAPGSCAGGACSYSSSCPSGSCCTPSGCMAAGCGGRECGTDACGNPCGSGCRNEGNPPDCTYCIDGSCRSGSVCDVTSCCRPWERCDATGHCS